MKKQCLVLDCRQSANALWSTATCRRFFGLADLSAKQRRVRRLAEGLPCPARFGSERPFLVDGDKSPVKSGDKSPHSKGCAVRRTRPPMAAGFTLVELLVVLAVLAFSAMLLVPALARTQPDSRAARCLNNHRQLARAWRMFADDNNERFPKVANSDISPSAVWAFGWLDWGVTPDNTNTVFLSDPRYSALATYCGKNTRIFKCPADTFLSPAQRSLWNERARSVAANWCVGSGTPFLPDPAYTIASNWPALVNPKPSETWLVMDEHPDSINDGGLFPPGSSGWIDLPANYHAGGAGLAYADGHSEIHRWQGRLLDIPVKFAYSAPPMLPNDPDVLWGRYHTPRRPGAN